MVAGVVFSFLAGSAAAATPRVSIDTGVLVGSLRPDTGVAVFKAVPYARPPVGTLRWRPPEPPAPWRLERLSKDAGPACMQPASPPQPFYAFDEAKMSEDCLYLNVFAPPGAEKTPVMVWIHGGSLINGAASDEGYDGERLAARGVIVVTINYRLGVFGYFSHPELSRESAHHASGNYGTLDQIAALQWVKRNIEAFGGDPSRVTIIGQSAGALSVAHLMTSPLAAGLFQSAVAESVYLPAMPELRASRFGLEPAETTGLKFGRAHGAADLPALRGLSAEALERAAEEQGLLKSARRPPS